MGTSVDTSTSFLFQFDGTFNSKCNFLEMIYTLKLNTNAQELQILY